MISTPTQDTQAILLLCARLGQRHDAAQPLSTRQYAALARWLHEHSLRPGSLLHAKGRAGLADLCLKGVDRDQVERLLDRGAALGLMVERWTSGGIWIISRGDDEYPARYKTYLQHAAPPIIYGVGEQSSLRKGGLAIVGSRHASDEDMSFAQRLGGVCAEQKIPVISGAAKGIDSESMMAAINQCGTAVGILAEGLGKAAVAAPYHDAILEGRLTLMSPYEPESRWFAFTAMERNKLIYALADAAVVVASSDEQGGTWAGAVEALRQGQIPIYVKTTGVISTGNRKLIEAGGQEFPSDAWHNISQLFNNSPRSSLLFDKRNQPKTDQNDKAVIELPSDAPTSIQSDFSSTESDQSGVQNDGSDAYSHVVEIILDITTEPVDEDSIAKKLDVLPSQAKAWLKRAVQEEKIQKLKKPVRYVRTSKTLSLFARKQELTASKRS
jgi:predicted Rossmann fold nucleotide-binding protein DprA/Smf involved in DNA uptake